MFDGAALATAADATDNAGQSPEAEQGGGLDGRDAVAGEAQGADARREVVFVDGGIADLQALIGGMPPGTEVVVLDAGRNGLEQMAEYLEGREGIDAIHLLSHGEGGAFKAGNAWIDAADLAGQSDTLARIGTALSADGDILLYGCKTGDGASGAALVSELARLTRADVAASSDNTGAVRLGGDWVLETQAGAIETTAIAASGFDALLAAPTTLDFDSVVVDGGGYSLGDSPRVFDGWIVSLLDASGSNVTGNSFLDVSANSGDSPIIAGGGDKALFANGEFAVVKFLQFAATDGSEFKLDSFSLSNPGLMGPNLQVIGYRDGTQVGTQNFVLSQDGSVLTVTLSGTAWQYIDTFRIVQQDNSSDIQFWIDDVNVSPAIAPNVAPVVGNLNGDSVAFTEGGSAVLLDAGGNATLTDSDSADFNGGNITVAIITNRVAGEDVLSVRHQGSGAGQVGLSGSAVLYGGVQVGTLTGGTGSTNMVISLNAQATPEAVQAILRNLTYDNTNTANPATLNRSIQVSVNDGDGGTSNLSLVTVSVTGVNDAPVLTPTAPTLTGLADSDINNAGQTVASIVGTSIDDVDSGAVEGIALTGLASGTGTWQYSLDGGGSWSNVGAVAANSALLLRATDRVRFVPDGVGGTTASITYVAWDQTSGTQGTKVDASSTGGTTPFSTASDTASITVTAVDDPSTVSTSGGTTAFTEGNNVISTPVAIDPGLTLSDPDSATLASATVSITGAFQSAQDVMAFVNDGSTMGDITGSYNAGTGVLTLTSAGGSATLAQWQAALRSVTYTNTSDLPNTSTRTISFVVNDGNSDSSAATKAVSVTAVNDAPIVTAAVSISVTEDSASALTGISFSDADAGSGSVTATFSVGSGTLAATSGGGVTVAGSGTGTLTLTGTVSNINTFIAASNLTFTTAANATADVTLTVGVNDGGNTGSGGAQTDSETVTLQVAAVNDAPVINAPVSIDVNEDEVTVLSGISVTDVDAGSGEIGATLSVSSGTLILNGDDVGQSMTLGGGTLQNLNDFFASGLLAFRTDANSTSNVVLTIQVEDFGNTGSGGSKTDITTVTLAVTVVNDAPVNSLPTAQSVDQDGVLVFSAGNSNLVSISDVDAGSGNVRVTLTVTNGLLTLGGTTGLSFITGDGTGDATMTFEGTLADINLAMNGMAYTPDAGYNGPASLQIVSNDLGLSGSGSNQTDTDTLAITVNSLNPAVTSVNTTNPDGGYKVGDTIQVTVSFDQAVDVDTSGGVPSLLLETGSLDRLATYVSGSGSNTLTFSYTVQAGDLSADLDYQSTGALVLNGATIRSATSDDAVLTLPTVGGANSIAGQHDVVVDGVAPTVSSVSVPADGVYVAGQNLDFTVNFGEAVTVDTSGGTPRIAVTLDTGGTVFAEYVAGSGSTALVFRLTVASGQLDSNGITLGGDIQINGGTLRDAVGNDATTTLNGVGSTSGVLVDAVNPVVASVSVPANGAYNAGDVLTFTVNASEAVLVNTAGGTPRLVLDIGGVTRYATYVSGSGTGALVFQYGVQAGDTDADGIAVTALEANGGTLRDAAGNTADLTLNNVAPTAGVVVDNEPPAVTGLVRADPTPTSAGSVRFTLTFSEAVSGVDVGDFSLVTTGTANGVIQSVAQVDAQTYRITVGSLSGDGTLRLDLNGTGTGIVDQAGNEVASGLTGEAYVLDSSEGTPASPVVTSVGVPPDGAYKAGDVLVFTVNASEPVVVEAGGGTPRLVLDIGGVIRHATYVSGSGSPVLVFQYVVQPGDTDTDGVRIGGALDLNGARVRDAEGNDLDGAMNGIGSTSRILVDTTAPLAEGIARADAGPIEGDTMRFTVTFSEAVRGVDAGDFGLVFTGTASGRIASVTPVDGRTYTVLVAGLTGNGTVRLDLNPAGTGITDAAGNPLAGGLAGEPHPIDREGGAVESVAVPPRGNYRTGQHLDFLVRFDEAVVVDTSGGAPTIAITLDGGIVVQAEYVGGSGSTQLTFRYTVESGHLDVDGIELGDAILPNGATLRDTQGNGVALALAGLPSTAGLRINTSAADRDPEFHLSPPAAPTPPTALLPAAPTPSAPPPSALMPGLLPPPLFEPLAPGGGIPTLGNVFLGDRPIAPSFLARVFASSSSGGDGSASGFLGFGGGDAGVFGQSTLSSVFGADAFQELPDMSDPFAARRLQAAERAESGAAAGAPSLAEQLRALRQDERRQIEHLAQALQAFGEADAITRE